MTEFPTRLYFPAQAVGAGKVFFDLFNASARPLVVQSVRAQKDGSVAVTGILGVKLYLTRTSAIGTGGTAANTGSATLTAPNFDKGKNAYILTGVTARAAPSGGATAGSVIGERQIFPEETNGATYEGFEFLTSGMLLVPVSTGIRVVQGAVASVGNIGFGVAFSNIT